MSRILIIEDDMTINGLLRNIIEKIGYGGSFADPGGTPQDNPSGKQ